MRPTCMGRLLSAACLSGPGRSGRIAPGMVGQGSAKQERAWSRRTGQGYEASVSAGHGWGRFGRTWYGRQNPHRGGMDSVRHCSTRQIRTGLVWVRIGHAIIGLDQVLGRAGHLVPKYRGLQLLWYSLRSDYFSL